MCFVNSKLSEEEPSIWASSLRPHFPLSPHPIIYQVLSILPHLCKVGTPSLNPCAICGLMKDPRISLDELTCRSSEIFFKILVSFLFLWEIYL